MEEKGCVCVLREGGDYYLVMNPASTLRVTIILVKYFQDTIAAMIQPTAQLRQEVEVREVPVVILLFGSRFNKRPLKKDLFSLQLTTLLLPSKAFRDRNRKSDFFNHLSAVSEGTDALLWVGAVR